MTVKRTPLRPEDDWRGASLGQVADLRVWARQRVTERDADVLAQWLLGLGPDTEPPVSRRRLRFYRRLLRGYGKPRTVPFGSNAAVGLTSQPAPEPAAADSPEEPGTPGDSTGGSTEASTGEPPGRAVRGGGFGRPRT